MTAISSVTIEWVKCPRCKRETAKATHCIYCGEDLGFRFEFKDECNE